VVKANAAFDIGTCRDFIVPVEFNGKEDALFHSRTRDGHLHMEYVLFRDSCDDVPVEKVVEWVTSALKPEARKGIRYNCMHLLRRYTTQAAPGYPIVLDKSHLREYSFSIHYNL
jgi:hypothetical protein